MLYKVGEMISSTLDLDELLELYHCHLTRNPPENPPDRQTYLDAFRGMLSNPNYHILIGLLGGKAVSSVTLVSVPNLTHGCRPYAFIENVVTHADYRGRGYATAVMAVAERLAREAGCYKIMLLTGSKSERIRGFYEKCGYNRRDKTAFVMWL
jgi:GNAT superfamily N-acetyltransferase